MNRTAGSLALNHDRLAEGFEDVVRAMVLERASDHATRPSESGSDMPTSLAKWFRVGESPRVAIGVLIGAVVTTLQWGVPVPASASLSIADVLEYAPDQRWFEQELAFWGGSSPDEMEALFQEFDDAAGRVLAAATLPLEDGEIRDWAEALARSVIP